MLEEGSFRGRTADFVMMFLFGGICMIVSLNFAQDWALGCQGLFFYGSNWKFLQWKMVLLQSR